MASAVDDRYLAFLSPHVNYIIYFNAQRRIE